MAFLQFNSSLQPQHLTGLAIIRAHQIWLVLEDTDETREIRELFLPFRNVSSVYERTVEIGQGRSYTELAWEEPIDDLHVPGLESLLRYLQQLGQGLTGPIGPRGLRGFVGAPGDVLLPMRGSRGAMGSPGPPGPRGRKESRT